MTIQRTFGGVEKRNRFFNFLFQNVKKIKLNNNLT